MTPDGKVKVLDFGLAKALGGETPVQDLSESPTLTRDATETGVLLGTAPYMSPEQARGKELDKRTDIWAFGCCLYEALAGKAAFLGDTVSDTLARILEREPDCDALPASTPALVRSLLGRCFHKDSNERLQHIGDARIEINEAITEPSVPIGAPIEAPPSTRWRQVLPWLLFGLAVALALWSLLRESPQVGLNISGRFVIPTNPLAVTTRGSAVALSPDGARLVFVGESDRERQLYLREINSLEVTPIPGTENADAPFFSPDSQWVAFFAEGKLKKVSLTGGPSLDIYDVPSTHSSTVEGSAVGSWGPHDTIVMAIGRELMQVSSNGGEPEIVATVVLEDGEYFLSGPEILPGGKAVLYTALNASCVAPRIFAQSLETGERRPLIEGGSPARYTPSGHLVYAQEGSLLAVPFDLERLEANGPPIALIEGVMMGFCGDAHFSISEIGSLAYVAGRRQELEHTLVWVDRKGNAEPLSDRRHFFFGPRLSPDGKKLAVWIGGGNTHVWIYEMARRILTPLTSEGQNFWPLWTLDGEGIVFPSIRSGEEANLYLRSVDGSGSAERLTESECNQQPLCWSPDGKMLVIQQSLHPTTGWDIWVLHMEGERKARPFLTSPFSEFNPNLSPDGRWLAYVSNESGRDEIYVTSFPQPRGRLQISTEGGTQPAWAPSGAELFYRNDRKMMAVDIVTEPELTPANPRLLFEGSYHQGSSYGRNYDVMPDGQRFIMVKTAAPETAPTQVHVVTNWFDELKRLVPTEN